MVFSRKIFSTRPAVALGVVIAIGLVALWSYCFSFINEVLCFGVALPVISIPIFWSLYEILKLKRRRLGRGFWIYLLLGYIFVLAPAFVALEKRDLRGLGIATLVILYEILLIVLWGWILGGRRSWYEDMSVVFRNKSFTSLLIGYVVFWNVLLFMVIWSLWYWVLFVFGLVMLNDTLAFFLGKAFGKRQLSEWSPSKTKEGLFGAIGLLTIAIIFFFTFIDRETRVLLLGEKEYWWIAIFLCVIGLFVSSFGDLYYSMHKRLFGIKDYSSVLGRHGGFWDRFDSSCFSLGFWGVSSLVWLLVR